MTRLENYYILGIGDIWATSGCSQGILLALAPGRDVVLWMEPE